MIGQKLRMAKAKFFWKDVIQEKPRTEFQNANGKLFKPTQMLSFCITKH